MCIKSDIIDEEKLAQVLKEERIAEQIKKDKNNIKKSKK